MERKQIFISHISKETTLAVALKERLVADFLGLPDVFVCIALSCSARVT